MSHWIEYYIVEKLIKMRIRVCFDYFGIWPRQGDFLGSWGVRGSGTVVVEVVWVESGGGVHRGPHSMGVRVVAPPPSIHYI